MRTASRNAAMPPASSPDWMSTRPRLLWASAKSGCRRMASRNSAATLPLSAPCAAEQAAQDVVRLGLARARGERLAEGGGRGLPVRRGQPRAGEVQPGLELSQRLVEIARPEVGDAEVDVDGGGRREERDRALQARPGPGEIARLAQRGAEKRVAAAGGGIEVDALAQLGQGPVAGAAVPERDAEVVVGLRGLRPERHRPLEVGEGRRQGLSAGPGRSPGGCARPRGSRPGARASVSCVAGGGQVAAPRRPRGRAGTRSSAGLVAAGRGGCARRPSALLLQGHAERVVGLALLGVDLERLLERGDGARAGRRSGAASARARSGRAAFVGSPSAACRRCGSAASRSPVSRSAMPRLKWAPRLFGSSVSAFWKTCDRLGVVAARGQRGAQVRVGPPVLRVELDGLPELGDGAGEIRLLREGDAEPVVRLGGARPDLHRAPELRRGRADSRSGPSRRGRARRARRDRRDHA